MSLHLGDRQTKLLADMFEGSILLTLPIWMPELDTSRIDLPCVANTGINYGLTAFAEGACLQAVMILRTSGSDKGIPN